MLQRLLDLFALQPEPAAPPPPAPRTVLVALLVRAARASDVEEPEQSAMIETVLQERYALAHDAQHALLREARALEARTGDTVHLTLGAKQEVALDDRPGLLTDMWRIILADGGRHENEDGLMRLVSSLLGLPDRESAFARQRAIAALRKAEA